MSGDGGNPTPIYLPVAAPMGLLCGPGQLRSGSALVSKFPCREHLAMIIISTISVKYNVIRAY